MLLEFAWAMQFLKESKAPPSAIYQLLNCTDAPARTKHALEKALLTKTFKIYFFDNSDGKTVVKDISALDAGSDDPAVSEWGGLTSFGSRASEIVAQNVPL
jgi:hypothetical protein